jgi:hypothetical protein
MDDVQIERLIKDGVVSAGGREGIKQARWIRHASYADFWCTA